MTSANQVPVNISNGETLLNTRLLDNEKIISEFTETPSCSTWCREGRIRRIQLTTHRLNYYESRREYFCFTAPPLLRQVFLKDVCDISVGQYALAKQSLLLQMITYLFLFGLPISGIVLIVLGLTYSCDYNSYDYCDTGLTTFYYSLGGSYLGIWFLLLFVLMCRSKVPEVAFGTHCPQFSAFAIRLSKPEDRAQLLEEVTKMMHKRQSTLTRATSSK